MTKNVNVFLQIKVKYNTSNEIFIIKTDQKYTNTKNKTVPEVGAESVITI